MDEETEEIVVGETGEPVCRVCGKPVQVPLTCSKCKAVFHTACITHEKGKIRKKKSYKCTVCGHVSESYSMQMT